jgi:hypothetical protein
MNNNADPCNESKVDIAPTSSDREISQSAQILSSHGVWTNFSDGPSTWRVSPLQAYLVDFSIADMQLNWRLESPKQRSPSESFSKLDVIMTPKKLHVVASAAVVDSISLLFC